MECWGECDYHLGENKKLLLSNNIEYFNANTE